MGGNHCERCAATNYKVAGFHLKQSDMIALTNHWRKLQNNKKTVEEGNADSQKFLGSDLACNSVHKGAALSFVVINDENLFKVEEGCEDMILIVKVVRMGDKEKFEQIQYDEKHEQTKKALEWLSNFGMKDTKELKVKTKWTTLPKANAPVREIEDDTSLCEFLHPYTSS